MTNPARRNAPHVLYLGLFQTLDPGKLCDDPTLSADDFAVSIDGGDFAPLTNTPEVAPAGSTAVRIALTATEMDGDDIVVVCRDDAGAEWCDALIHIATSPRSIDDLAFPETSGRGLVVDASGQVAVAAADIRAAVGLAAADLGTQLSTLDAVADAIKQRTDNLPDEPAATGDAMTLTSGEREGVAAAVEAAILDEGDSQAVQQAIVDAIGAANPDLGGLTLEAIAGAVRDELSTELGHIDADISSRLAAADYDAPDNAGIAALDAVADAIKAQTDQLVFSTAGRLDAQVHGMEADAVSSGAISTGAVTKLQSGLSTLNGAGVRTAVGLESANLDAQLGGLAATASAIEARTDLIPASPAAIGDIPSAETIATAVEAALLDEEDSQAVQQALVAAIAAANPDLGGLTLEAIAGGVRAELAPELAHLDADISSRLAAGDYEAADNAGIAVVAGLVEKLEATLEEHGEGWRFTAAALAETPAAAGGDPWASTVPGSYSAGTAGYALGRIGTGRIETFSPTITDGRMTIVRGDDYRAADGRAFEWVDGDGAWPTLSGASITLTIGGQTFAGSVIGATGAGKRVRLELTSTQSATVPAGSQSYDLAAILSGGNKVTLARGKAAVVSDV